MRSVSRTVVVAAGVWLALHATLGMLYLDSVRVIPLYVLAMLVMLAGSALALRPLFLPPDAAEPRRTPVLLATAIPLAQGLDLLSLERGYATSYANWASGGAAVMLAGLVLRHRGGLAVLAGAASVAMMAAAYLSQEAEPNLAAVFLLAVPAQMWVLAPYAVRTVVTRAEHVAQSLNARAATEAASGPVRDDWESVRGVRLRELEQQVLPFLAHVSDVDHVGPVERAQADALARTLRDSLLARQLLDPRVQAALAQARARGVQVSLSTDATAGPLTAGLRPLLPDLLALPGLTALSVRVGGVPQVATLVVKGSARSREVMGVLGILPDVFTLARARTAAGLVVTVRATG